MFGYVTINKPELKIREYERYHSFYCGLCHILKQRHGWLGQFTLTYDMTFLVLLLSSLYAPPTYKKKSRCPAHPAKSHLARYNQITEYCADMNIALAYHNFADDWQDDKSIKSIAGMNLLQKSYQNVHAQYPTICGQIEKYLKQLSALESNCIQDIDKTSGCFGRLMGILFDYKQDIWSPYLRRFGFYLGKFIYIMDACLDLEDDLEKKHFNPLTDLYKSMERDSFIKTCHSMLELMIADACSEFEKLPLTQDLELMRNILYAGVWTQYNKHRAKQQERN